MRPLVVARLPEWSEKEVRVTRESTIRVKKNTYSVPSRLREEQVRVRVYDGRLEVYYGGEHQLTVERLAGSGRHRINYRHVIWSLVRKPGAFRLYRYREEMFPTLTFRRAYDALREGLGERQADLEYLRVLHLAASTMEAGVEAVLALLLERGDVPRAEVVKELVAPATPQVPELEVPQVDLGAYDALLEGEEVA